MALKPRFTDADIDAHALQAYEEAEKALIETLQYVGEGFVREARLFTSEQGGFGDITGNLRSSIGYFIVKNGEVITEDIQPSKKGTDKRTGMRTAKDYIGKIKSGNGLFLYGIAGMEYASKLEKEKG